MQNLLIKWTTGMAKGYIGRRYGAKFVMRGDSWTVRTAIVSLRAISSPDLSYNDVGLWLVRRP